MSANRQETMKTNINLFYKTYSAELLQFITDYEVEEINNLEQVNITDEKKEEIKKKLKMLGGMKVYIGKVMAPIRKENYSLEIIQFANEGVSKNWSKHPAKGLEKDLQVAISDMLVFFEKIAEQSDLLTNAFKEMSALQEKKQLISLSEAGVTKQFDEFKNIQSSLEEIQSKEFKALLSGVIQELINSITQKRKSLWDTKSKLIKQNLESLERNITGYASGKKKLAIMDGNAKDSDFSSTSVESLNQKSKINNEVAEIIRNNFQPSSREVLKTLDTYGKDFNAIPLNVLKNLKLNVEQLNAGIGSYKKDLALRPLMDEMELISRLVGEMELMLQEKASYSEKAEIASVLEQEVNRLRSKDFFKESSEKIKRRSISTQKMVFEAVEEYKKHIPLYIPKLEEFSDCLTEYATEFFREKIENFVTDERLRKFYGTSSATLIFSAIEDLQQTPKDWNKEIVDSAKACEQSIIDTETRLEETIKKASDKVITRSKDFVIERINNIPMTQFTRFPIEDGINQLNVLNKKVEQLRGKVDEKSIQFASLDAFLLPYDTQIQEALTAAEKEKGKIEKIREGVNKTISELEAITKNSFVSDDEIKLARQHIDALTVYADSLSDNELKAKSLNELEALFKSLIAEKANMLSPNGLVEKTTIANQFCLTMVPQLANRAEFGDTNETKKLKEQVKSLSPEEIKTRSEEEQVAYLDYQCVKFVDAMQGEDPDSAKARMLVGRLRKEALQKKFDENASSKKDQASGRLMAFKASMEVEGAYPLIMTKEFNQSVGLKFLTMVAVIFPIPALESYIAKQTDKTFSEVVEATFPKKQSYLSMFGFGFLGGEKKATTNIPPVEEKDSPRSSMDQVSPEVTSNGNNKEEEKQPQEIQASKVDEKKPQSSLWAWSSRFTSVVTGGMTDQEKVDEVIPVMGLVKNYVALEKEEEILTLKSKFSQTKRQDYLIKLSEALKELNDPKISASDKQPIIEALKKVLKPGVYENLVAESKQGFKPVI